MYIIELFKDGKWQVPQNIQFGLHQEEEDVIKELARLMGDETVDDGKYTNTTNGKVFQYKNKFH